MNYISNVNYSYIPFSDMNNLEDDGLNVCAELILKYRKKDFNQNQKLFIGGCGDGREAFFFHKRFNCQVVGVDYGLTSDQINDSISIYKGNLMDLKWVDNEFDAVFSYHVLEHVGDPILALENLKRVLKSDEIMLIGFPNRKRLFGYIGSRNVNFMTKIKWNLSDYKSRLSFRFQNKYGAHAGFSEKEFLHMSKNIFSDIIPVTNEYMLNKYASKSLLINFLIKMKISNFLFPSLYFICKK
jgi:ubiquinone/menaquinone biosynthesis C-methylase UbiE